MQGFILPWCPRGQWTHWEEMWLPRVQVKNLGHFLDGAPCQESGLSLVGLRGECKFPLFYSESSHLSLVLYNLLFKVVWGRGGFLYYQFMVGQSELVKNDNYRHFKISYYWIWVIPIAKPLAPLIDHLSIWRVKRYDKLFAFMAERGEWSWPWSRARPHLARGAVRALWRAEGQPWSSDCAEVCSYQDVDWHALSKGTLITWGWESR